MAVNTQENFLKEETLLTPRFYTTNFRKIASMDFNSNISQIEAIVNELRQDYNKSVFIRNSEFSNIAQKFNKQTQQQFIDFLERSCIAEFSGFLLYKEISRNLKPINPLLSEGFALMARDEARHAGFLNKAIGDFNVSLNLGFLTKTRKYTYFPPQFIFYATYISEKIGYWRYITIYRHFEKNPENRIFPIFRFFESWCQDENRHGDFFASILKSQPRFLETKMSIFWCKFFLLTIFLTMYLNDAQKDSFYNSFELDTTAFNKYVIVKTNETVGAVFPIILDTKHPKFFRLFDSCVLINKKIDKINKTIATKAIKFILKMPLYFLMVKNLASLFILPTIKSKNLKF